MKRFNGFTLAEVLITLAIVGVVAAMTLPTLIANHQKQVYVTGLKKGINIIQNSINQMKADEMTDIENTELFIKGICSGDSDSCADFVGDNQYVNYSVVQEIFSRYLKVVKTYKPGEYSRIYKQARLNATTKEYTESYSIDMGNNYIAFYTPDGMIFYISSYGWGGLEAYIDVNGDKGPNKQGRDLFWLNLLDRYRPDSTSKSYEYDDFATYLMKNGWKMDY